jgi:hypothetical protein
MPITAIGAGVGILGSIGKMIGRGRANRELRRLQSEMPQWQKQAGMAQTLLNARMPGAAQAERNIYQQEANQLANAQRAATSGNQLLLAGAGATGQANQAFNQLGQAEATDYQRRYGNLTAAQAADYEAAMQQYGLKSQIQGAQQENRQNTWGDVAGLGFGVANFAAQGGFGNLGGKTTLTPSINRMVMPGANTGLTTQLRVPSAVSAYSQAPNIPNYLNPNAMPYAQSNASQVGNWWQSQGQ